MDMIAQPNKLCYKGGTLRYYSIFNRFPQTRLRFYLAMGIFHSANNSVSGL